MLSPEEHGKQLLNGRQFRISQQRCVCPTETDKGYRSGLFILGFPGSGFASTPASEGSQVARPRPRTLSSSLASRCLPAHPAPASAPRPPAHLRFGRVLSAC